jgi:trehalose synthase
VVASAVGGISDQIIDGESGVLIRDPTDLAAFAGTLDELLADPTRRSALGDAARARVIDHFLPDSQLARWHELLFTLASPRG